MKERALAGSYGDLPIIGGLARRDLPALDETELPEAEMGDLNTDDDTPALTLDEDLPLDDGADADTAKLPVARGLTDESCARIVNDAESQLTPLLQQITSVTSGDKLDIDTLSPLVSQVGDILNDVTGKVAALSNVGETGRVSANDLSTTVAPFVNSILSTFNTIMETSSTETETVTATHILSGATTDLAGLLQSLKTVFGSDIDTVLVPLLQTSGQALQMVNSLGLNSITSDLPLAGKVNEVVSGLKNTGL
ncbi:hypothetical protein V5O48_017247 [Marasmius crinis-equi]|uniref:Uncharacterized protein n=1 Tax=Marasmius crinis-equi TaxID=585013 RepID=A0ABR3EPH7_9AGAR